MIEQIRETIGNIKERVSNPFVFSFIASWLVFNWKIPLAILKYDHDTVVKQGFTSHYNLIETTLGEDESFFYPVLFALVYTLLIPIVRNLITALNSWATRWGNNWSLNLLGNGSVSVGKYLKLVNRYEERTKALVELISKESEYLDKYEQGQKELIQAQADGNDLKDKLNKSTRTIANFRNMEMLNGSWECNYILPDGTRGKEVISINDGRYYLVSSLDDRQQIFDIKDFFYDERSRLVYFIKEMTEDRKKVRREIEHININRLTMESPDLLIGTENARTRIEYKRINK